MPSQDFECQQCYAMKSTEGSAVHSFQGHICADCAAENRRDLGDEAYEEWHDEYFDAD